MSKDNLTEFDRRLITGEGYSNYSPNDKVKVISKGERKDIGTVREVVTDDFGQKAYVIQSVDKKKYQSFIEDQRVQEHQDQRLIGSKMIFQWQTKS
ncbi:hypothetical protein [Streptococcus uberis]|uniref:hypothetical protein n=1 Tax=Streptococcus uberis TaxID=1349 RepID=UPI0018A78367|nr:hypothetical protein [Streptococcus uberis]